jgi:NADH:ubiquinone oxidoreductase subunit 6 (subunit J)
MLIDALLVLLAASGAGVVLTRRPVRQVLALAVNGLVMALLFLALQAPDVAFAQVVVATAAVPMLFLATLSSMRMDRRPGNKEK